MKPLTHIQTVYKYNHESSNLSWYSLSFHVKTQLFFEIVTHITLILNSKLSYIYKCINYKYIWRLNIFVWLDLWIVNIVMWD
jgi:hypothetical protein